MDKTDFARRCRALPADMLHGLFFSGNAVYNTSYRRASIRVEIMHEQELINCVDLEKMLRPPFSVRVYGYIMIGWGMVLTLFTMLAVLSVTSIAGKAYSAIPSLYGTVVIIFCLRSGLGLLRLQPASPVTAVITFAFSSLIPIFVFWYFVVTRLLIQKIPLQSALQQSIAPIVYAGIVMAVLTVALAYALHQPNVRRWFRR